MFAFYRTYLTSNTESLELVFICLFVQRAGKRCSFSGQKAGKAYTWSLKKLENCFRKLVATMNLQSYLVKIDFSALAQPLSTRYYHSQSKYTKSPKPNTWLPLISKTVFQLFGTSDICFSSFLAWKTSPFSIPLNKNAYKNQLKWFSVRC